MQPRVGPEDGAFRQEARVIISRNEQGPSAMRPLDWFQDQFDRGMQGLAFTQPILQPHTMEVDIDSYSKAERTAHLVVNKVEVAQMHTIGGGELERGVRAANLTLTYQTEETASLVKRLRGFMISGPDSLISVQPLKVAEKLGKHSVRVHLEDGDSKQTALKKVGKIVVATETYRIQSATRAGRAPLENYYTSPAGEKFPGTQLMEEVV
jgi:hypothetical protein